MVYFWRTQASLLYWRESRSWNSLWSHHLLPWVAQNLASTEASHPSTWKLLYEATNGALDQSVFSSPPLVAQSSAFHRLEYIFMGWSNGNLTPKSLLFLNTLIGTSSTKNLIFNTHQTPHAYAKFNIYKTTKPHHIKYKVNSAIILVWIFLSRSWIRKQKKQGDSSKAYFNKQ